MTNQNMFLCLKVCGRTTNNILKKSMRKVLVTTISSPIPEKAATIQPQSTTGFGMRYGIVELRIKDVDTVRGFMTFVSKRTIITRAEQNYGRVPFAGLCRLFISVYVPGAGLPGARASAFPAPHGSEICPDRAAYSAPAIDTHKAQCRWPWPFPPANTQWHWIPLP